MSDKLRTMSYAMVISIGLAVLFNSAFPERYNWFYPSLIYLVVFSLLDIISDNK